MPPGRWPAAVQPTQQTSVARDAPPVDLRQLCAVRFSEQRQSELRGRRLKIQEQRKKLQEKLFGDSSRSAVTAERATLTLVCPYTKTRMMLPVRGKYCRHVECFCFFNWLTAAVQAKATSGVQPRSSAESVDTHLDAAAGAAAACCKLLPLLHRSGAAAGCSSHPRGLYATPNHSQRS